MEGLTGAIVLALYLLIYFLPTILATNRKHRNVRPVFVLNLLLGWTFLGWVIAMIWANTTVRQPKPARQPPGGVTLSAGQTAKPRLTGHSRNS